MDRRELGRFGEEQAAKYLRRHGYRIVEMNYSCRFGEIDIIAESLRYIVFAEVKLRKNDLYGEAKEFVTRAKQERIITTAYMYLEQNETRKQPRFDVIEIYAPSGMDGKIRLNHIENAFGEE